MLFSRLGVLQSLIGQNLILVEKLLSKLTVCLC
ncbi:hypothetical protein T03_7452 [Trichinella britovi]|uniref:Uncharacterized protein n=1 Tax=Trichinella britovi TaxID=45882 RepID=A0A0V1C588_TRIBR|nr:hypothetical protein T03_7452 [Trichinella britovi]